MQNKVFLVNNKDKLHDNGHVAFHPPDKYFIIRGKTWLLFPIMR
jgi:hypothetical protein